MQNEDCKLDSNKLNEMYSKAESCDKAIFSEMKSNILLISGKHYSRSKDRLLARTRDMKGDDNQKLRLVKNHVYRIVRIYLNEILRQAPWVRPVPYSESELQDQKAAELANSVWVAAKAKHNLHARVRQWASSFVDIGECCVKIFWDPNKGKLVGYKQKLSEQGSPLFAHPMTGEATVDSQTIDPMSGQIVSHEPIQDEKLPVFSGEFVFENVLPFNLLRSPKAETMEDSPYLIVRKMVDIKTAKALCGGDENKEAFVQESSKSTFKVFDGMTGEYSEAKDQVMLREYFFRPSIEYPQGWYILATENGIISEMELPFGIFPLAWAGFEETPTTPRANSIIRVLRPYQGELNRMASSQSTGQIAFGDDKLIVQAGSKVSPGAAMSGVRVISVSGIAPTILPGRSSEQWQGPIDKTIAEMYTVANLQEIQQEVSGQLDANVLLFRSMRQKQKFSIYSEKFEQFLKEVCQIYLGLAQKSLPEDELIRQVGKREAVNIDEFRKVSELEYSIKLESIGEDIESMLGKSLAIQQVLQYCGKDLPPEARGQIINAMPFMNDDKMFGDLTSDSRNADSDILALDRGQFVPPKQGENHEYILKRLYGRQKMRDYDLLSPQIHALYEAKIKAHSDMKAEELSKLAQLEQAFIPMAGALIGVDQFVTVPNAHGGQKTVRAKIPSDAVQWLIEKLEIQGKAQQSIQEMPVGAQAGVASSFMDHQAPMQAPQGGPPGVASPSILDLMSSQNSGLPPQPGAPQ